VSKGPRCARINSTHRPEAARPIAGQKLLGGEAARVLEQQARRATGEPGAVTRQERLEGPSVVRRRCQRTCDVRLRELIRRVTVVETHDGRARCGPEVRGEVQMIKRLQRPGI
jgi:hypothetical protein